MLALYQRQITGLGTKVSTSLMANGAWSNGCAIQAALCDAHHIPVSSHCAPALHVHIGCTSPSFRHAEYFHDHVRIERMIFDGVVRPVAGTLRPGLDRPGLGLTLKRADAQKVAI